jgi:hypothetical protein
VNFSTLDAGNDIAPFTVSVTYKRRDDTFGSSFIALMMKAVHNSETSVYFYEDYMVKYPKRLLSPTIRPIKTDSVPHSFRRALKLISVYTNLM